MSSTVRVATFVAAGLLVCVVGCRPPEEPESDGDAESDARSSGDSSLDVDLGDSGNDVRAETGTDGGDAVSYRGFCTRQKFDDRDDGTVDSVDIEHWVNEKLVAYKRDRGADGNFDYGVEYERDSEGDIVERLYDENNDGSPEYRTSWSEDDDGRVTDVERTSLSDDTIVYEEHYKYDLSGNLTDFWYDGRIDGLEIKEAADGNEDYRKTFTWHSSGDIKKREWDTDADGAAEVVWEQSFDNQGRPTEFTYDGAIKRFQRDNTPSPAHWSAKDGTVDIRDTFTAWDNNGRVKAIERDGRFSTDSRILENADGTADTKFVWAKRNADGRITRSEYDFGNDGSVDVVSTSKWDDDTLVRRSWDGLFGDDRKLKKKKDGSADLVRKLEQTSSGKPSRLERDWGADGSPEVVIEWKYDSNGRRTTYRRDGNTPQYRMEVVQAADGTPDALIEESYLQADIEKTYSYSRNGTVQYSWRRKRVDCSKL